MLPNEDATAAHAVACVDDEPLLLRGMTRLLGREYAVSGFESVDAVLASIAVEGPPAVLVADLRLAPTSGLALIERVCAEHPATVGVLITGHPDLSSAVEGINRGCVFRYLVKPVDPDDLGEAVGAAMAEHLVRREMKAVRERQLGDRVRGRVGRGVRVEELAENMVLGADVRTRDGLLLFRKGQELSGELIERLVKIKRSRGIREPFLVWESGAAARAK